VDFIIPSSAHFWLGVMDFIIPSSAHFWLGIMDFIIPSSAYFRLGVVDFIILSSAHISLATVDSVTMHGHVICEVDLLLSFSAEVYNAGPVPPPSWHEALHKGSFVLL
jgi:hypothetical protein